MAPAFAASYYHAGGVELAAQILPAAWTTNLLDGPLAGRDPRGTRTWIGDHDLQADLTVALGL